MGKMYPAKKGLKEKVNKAKTESDTRVKQKKMELFHSLLACRCVFLLPAMRART